MKNLYDDDPGAYERVFSGAFYVPYIIKAKCKAEVSWEGGETRCCHCLQMAPSRPPAGRRPLAAAVP